MTLPTTQRIREELTVSQRVAAVAAQNEAVANASLRRHTESFGQCLNEALARRWTVEQACNGYRHARLKLTQRRSYYATRRRIAAEVVRVNAASLALLTAAQTTGE